MFALCDDHGRFYLYYIERTSECECIYTCTLYMGLFFSWQRVLCCITQRSTWLIPQCNFRRHSKVFASSCPLAFRHDIHSTLVYDMITTRLDARVSPIHVFAVSNTDADANAYTHVHQRSICIFRTLYSTSSTTGLLYRKRCCFQFLAMFV